MYNSHLSCRGGDCLLGLHTQGGVGVGVGVVMQECEWTEQGVVMMQECEWTAHRQAHTQHTATGAC